LREQLKKPLGSVMGEAQAAERLSGLGGLVISVGDRCSHALIKMGIRPDIVIYDHMCMRKEVDAGTRRALDGYDGAAERVGNPAGNITDALRLAVENAVARGIGKILVDGEEDLAALVAIMAAPDGAAVLYGQPGEGIVLVEVDEKARRGARAIYGRMPLSA